MATRKKPTPRPRKATSDRVSTAAGKLLRYVERGYAFDAVVMDLDGGVRYVEVTRLVKMVVGSALGQDETGRKKRAGRKGTK